MTETAFPQPQTLKRCAILGTAQSLAMTPWQDATLEMWGLNDAYLLNFQRANRWFDLHPFHQMHFRPPQAGNVIASSVAQEIPVGAYVRPHGHLDWLRTRAFPVYLAEPHADFPNAKVFPREQVLQFFAKFWPLRFTRKGTIQPGPDYEVSTPSWMLMQAIAEGYQEIHVYGIHLATEWEYVQQRPNFEFLLGVAAGLGIKIVLPDTTPICKASYRYAFEPKADLPQQEINLKIGLIKQEGLKLQQERAKLPVYAVRDRKDLDARIAALDVDLMDARQQQQRLHAMSV